MFILLIIITIGLLAYLFDACGKYKKLLDEIENENKN